jgi:hypothetical protein
MAFGIPSYRRCTAPTAAPRPSEPRGRASCRRATRS